MKKYITALAIGTILAVSTAVGVAKSELASICVTPLWPTNAHPGNVLLYGVTIERTGAGLLEVNFNCASLPPGATTSFASARFTGNKPASMYFIMTVTTTEPQPIDSCAFALTGSARQKSMSVTNEVQSVPATTGPVLVHIDLRPDGDVELRGRGGSGEFYQIEATSDLGSGPWTTVGNCSADGNGRFTFIHEDAQSAPMRFYRAVKSAP